MWHAAAFMSGIPNGEFAQFLAPKGVVEQGGQDADFEAE